MTALKQALPAEHLAPFVANLTEMREAIIASDEWRSFFIIMIGCLFLFLYQLRKLKASFTLAGIALLCLIDMWSVNKRYLNDEQFVPKSKQSEAFVKTQADEIIPIPFSSVLLQSRSGRICLANLHPSLDFLSGVDV